MTTYREEAKATCPACNRTVAAVRRSTRHTGLDGSTANVRGVELLVSRHLYQEGTDINGIGLPILNADGFCPGSLETAKEPIRNTK
jgi:hypothetical protein